MDESLANSMTDRQLDELIIETEYQRIKEYYNANNAGPEGEQAAADWKKEAYRKINN